ACLPTLALAGTRLLGDHVADLTLAVPLAGVLLAPGVIAEAVLLQRADRHLEDTLAIGQDDALLAHDVRQVLLDRFLDLLFMPLLVHQPLAVQRPVLPRDGRSAAGARS